MMVMEEEDGDGNGEEAVEGMIRTGVTMVNTLVPRGGWKHATSAVRGCARRGPSRHLP